ncbi:hypothetical protein [Streptomyces sp. NPDC053726]|uniref:hypothetical protein n=1 Tax=Streptomyces sp. NPDC053726 TaxID=3365713 RepID=UPI0037D43805
MSTRTTARADYDGNVKRPDCGDLIFVYGGDPGLVTRLEGWALSMIELSLGDGLETALRRMVAVYRTPTGELDVAACVVPLAAAETAWHLVNPDGDIVNGGPCGRYGELPSRSRAELEDDRDSGRYKSHIGAVAVYGIPGTSRHAPSPADDNEGMQPPADGSFIAARGGHYRWYEPQHAASAALGLWRAPGAVCLSTPCMAPSS